MTLDLTSLHRECSLPDNYQSFRAHGGGQIKLGNNDHIILFLLIGS